MRTSVPHQTAGFTLVELLIGTTLSLMIMGAVLSSYVFLGRNFTRSLGLSSANQPTLESQGRRTLTAFARDVRMASGIDTTGIAPKVLPSDTGVTLIIPGSSSPTTVTYVYDSTAQTLTRIAAGGSSQILNSNLLSFDLNYFDAAGNPYTSYTNYLSGIKQVSMSFSSQAGLSINGTLSQVYQSASPRLVIRNRQFLP